jgi:hypothetical protein
MNLPHDQLGMDCRAGIADNVKVSNQVAASTYKGNPCPGGMVAIGTAAPSLAPVPWVAGSLSLLALLRRKRRSG